MITSIYNPGIGNLLKVLCYILFHKTKVISLWKILMRLPWKTFESIIFGMFLLCGDTHHCVFPACGFALQATSP
jgi:hypothetical protein